MSVVADDFADLADLAVPPVLDASDRDGDDIGVEREDDEEEDEEQDDHAPSPGLLLELRFFFRRGLDDPGEEEWRPDGGCKLALSLSLPLLSPCLPVEAGEQGGVITLSFSVSPLLVLFVSALKYLLLPRLRQ